MTKTPPSSKDNLEARKQLVLRIGIFSFLIAATLVAAYNRDQLSFDKMKELGYLGVFLMALIGSTTVLLPIPHLAFTFTMGVILNPWISGLCAGTGDSLGELFGFLAGYTVENLVDRWKIYPTVQGWVQRHGMLTVFLMGIVPMPLFDMAGMAAGASGMPVWKFYLATWSGKTLKAIAAGWAGHYGLTWVREWLQI